MFNMLKTGPLGIFIHNVLHTSYTYMNTEYCTVVVWTNPTRSTFLLGNAILKSLRNSSNYKHSLTPTADRRPQKQQQAFNQCTVQYQCSLYNYWIYLLKKTLLKRWLVLLKKIQRLNNSNRYVHCKRLHRSKFLSRYVLINTGLRWRRWTKPTKCRWSCGRRSK